MTIVFDEFDTTIGGFSDAVAAKILTHPDWADITPTLSTTLTAASTSGATVYTVASTAGFVVGQHVVVTFNSVAYALTITAISSATSLTVNTSTGVAMTIGTPLALRAKLLKATTTRGAQMVVDLNPAPRAALHRHDVDVWRTHTGASNGGTDSVRRYLYSRINATSLLTTTPIHVIVSVSKEHLFIGVEGPTAAEPLASSTTAGSLRTYLAISDLVPYHSADVTPAVVVSGNLTAYTGTVQASTGLILAQQVDISRSADDTQSWDAGRMASLQFPNSRGPSEASNMPLTCTIDGKTYLLPYVTFSAREGIRGRLARFFFAGANRTGSQSEDPVPVGAQVTFDGIVYKLMVPSKGDTAVSVYSGFGAGGSGTDGYAGVVVAVPIAEA
jgi:hypothetical protein